MYILLWPGLAACRWRQLSSHVRHHVDRSVVILALNLGLVVLVWLLRASAKKDPARFWVYLLYGLQLGPRSDVKYMTKTELYDSGVRFIVWGLIFTSAFWAVGIAARFLHSSPDTSPLMAALWFGLSLLAGMGFLGGFYLVIRGLLRPHSYIPPSTSVERGDA